MDTMKQITLNAPGVGDLAVFRTARALSSSDDGAAGHDVAVTTGEDGVVYFVDINTEKSFLDAVVCDGTMPAVAVVPEQTHLLVVSGDENALYSYKMPPQFERDALLLRSPVAIRYVACSAKYIAVATEDTEIKVLRRAATDQIIAIQGHEHGVKSVAFDPRDDRFLCSASEDGTVRVFELNEEALSATQLAVFKVQYGDIRSEEVFCRCAWTPDVLVVPVNQSILELFDRTTWKSKGQLMLPIGKSKSADINILSVSPNGLYVAGATLKQEVFVWNVSKKEIVRSFRVEHDIVAVQWAEGQNTLLVFNNGGRLGFVKDVIPMGLTPPHNTGLGAQTTSSVGSTAQKKTIEKPKKKRLNASQFVDDEAVVDGDDGDDDDDEEAELTGVEAIKASFGFGSAAASADADLGLSTEKLDDEDDQDVEFTSNTFARNTAAASPFQTYQEPFQSGSVTDGSVSLLAWTPLGEIECIRGASRSEHLVKVEFADKSRRGFKFSDNYLFSMAVLDDRGAFFAVPRRAREDWDDSVMNDHENGDIISSFIFYRPFDSWASNSSWHLDLPEGEDAESIATAQEFCAVATSLNCLRVYTTGGIAFALLRLPGRVVTMAAHGSFLAVVYQDGVARLGFKMFDIRVTPDADRVRVLAEGVLPLTPPIVEVFASHKENEQARRDISQYPTLSWLGFDERGVLYAVDSFGCVQALAKSYGWQWFPLGVVGNALSKKPEERPRIFTLGVVNNTLLFFPLEKGASGPRLRGKHRPVPLKFALQHASFPTTRSSKGDGAPPVVNDLWQQVRLSALDDADIATEDKRVFEQAEMDKSLILMMKAACTNDEPARVLDLAKCLHLEKSHQIAQKLAVHFGFRALQTQLYDLYRDRFERMERHAPAVSHHPRHTSQPAQAAEPMGSRPQPRLARQPKPQPPTEHDEPQVQDEKATSAPSSPRAKRAPESAEESLRAEEDNHAQPSNVTTTKPRIERSVVPANPFLKKPSPKSNASSGADSKKKTAGGLERLAKFTSPPPAKRPKPWK